MKFLVRAAMAATMVVASPVFAQSPFTTINIDQYVNANVALNPSTLPIGLSTGNMGTDIPFLVSSQINGISSVYLSPSVAGATLTVDLTPYGITGQQSFYALLNNYFGTPGVNEYDIVISSANRSVTYQSIGGVDTRDYNYNPNTTGTIGANTSAWFDNGRTPNSQRYDVRQFVLSGDFGNETLTSFQIIQRRAQDRAIFAGLTFSSLPVGQTGGVPEPATWLMMIAGFGLIGGSIRRQRTSVARFA